MIDRSFWEHRKVFLSGHTGFVGTWLTLWLHSLGARVTGYALEPPTEPNLFTLGRLDALMDSVIADVRDGNRLGEEMRRSAPEIVFHLAAQPIVREAYRNPAETYGVNVMGTVNLLEAARSCGTVKAVLIFTSDKCYENREWIWGYRENDPLGGYDPYSSSKACAEFVTSAYRQSFFSPETYEDHGVGLASVRAGNIIGGGDWGADRLVPDCIRAFLGKEKVVVRNPGAIRPWQHVLEPLHGCLMVAENLCRSGPAYSSGWNFGPGTDDARSVESLVRTLCERWDGAKGYRIDDSPHPHEAHYLKLDCAKAVSLLGWRQRWSLDTAIDKVLDWTRGYVESRDVREICLQQIADYGTGEKG